MPNRRGVEWAVKKTWKNENRQLRHRRLLSHLITAPKWFCTLLQQMCLKQHILCALNHLDIRNLQATVDFCALLHVWQLTNHKIVNTLLFTCIEASKSLLHMLRTDITRHCIGPQGNDRSWSNWLCHIFQLFTAPGCAGLTHVPALPAMRTFTLHCTQVLNKTKHSPNL